MEERLVYFATKRLLTMLLPDTVYTFNRYFLKGFDAQRGYLSHSISIDEFSELDAFFSFRSFNPAQLAARLDQQVKKVNPAKIKNRSCLESQRTPKKARNLRCNTPFFAF